MHEALHSLDMAVHSPATVRSASSVMATELDRAVQSSVAVELRRMRSSSGRHRLPGRRKCQGRAQMGSGQPAAVCHTRPHPHPCIPNHLVLLWARLLAAVSSREEALCEVSVVRNRPRSSLWLAAAHQGRAAQERTSSSGGRGLFPSSRCTSGLTLFPKWMRYVSCPFPTSSRCTPSAVWRRLLVYVWSRDWH